MEELKEKIRKEASELGFADIGFTSVEPFTLWRAQVDALEGEARPRGLDRMADDPLKELPAATCLIVLAMPYNLAGGFPQGTAPYSNYYFVSQQAHHAVTRLAENIRGSGHEAIPNPKLPAKHAALRAFGGHWGDNSLFIHPVLGSMCCIRMILTDACLPDAPPLIGASECSHCGLCEAACPTGAIGLGGFNAGKCLRTHQNRGYIPEAERGRIHSVLGCDLCGAACPHNAYSAPERADPHTAALFSFENLLSGASLAELKERVGENMLRHDTLRISAMMIAANTGLRDLLPRMREFAASAEGTAAEQAAWAVNRLEAPEK
jgi:epoxyqueuosine reductase QueG